MRSWFRWLGSNRSRQQGRLSRIGQVEDLESRAMMAGLVHEGDLGYLGAFNVPQGELGSSTFEYGGTALAYNAANQSLFMVGHDRDQNIAEISIPALHTGSQQDLATAGLVQSFAPVLNRIPAQTLNSSDNPVKLGGLIVDGDRLIGTAYEYYDADQNAVDSHFTLSSLDLDAAEVGGMYQVGDMGGGFVGGYMTDVPSEWQDEIGAPYLTGQAGLSIIARTSAGPAAFGFNPAELGASPAAATALVNYPLSNPLALETTQNPLFNTATEIKGVVFPEGTDSVLFIGSHGTGQWWYGEPDEGDLHDPYRPEKGPHAPEYKYQVWAYDVHDLIAVKNGEKQPWEVQPYDVWNFELPYADGAHHIGGAAYDAATGRLYVSQQYGNESYPVIHAFQVSTPDSDSNPDPDPSNQPPIAVTLMNTLGSLSEMTSIAADLKVAEIVVADDNLGTNDLTLSGPDQDLFLIGGSSLYLKAGGSLDFEDQSALMVTITASDASLGGAVSGSYALQIADSNDAPVLDNSLNTVLGTISEDPFYAFYTPLYSLVSSSISDQDAIALKGIAVTAASDFNGRWEYTLNGGMSWQTMGQPIATNPLLLPADGMAQVRFLPKANFNGTVKLWYHAWDRTQGTVGGTLPIAGNLGGSGSLSTALESASLTILPVNDAPALSLSGNIGYKLNSQRIVLAPYARASDVDSANFAGGELRVSIGAGTDASNRLEIGGPFTVNSNKVFYQGLFIGTVTSKGVGTNPLTIAFTYRATPAVVQLLVRSLTFRTFGATVSANRSIYFHLTDGDGGTSIMQTKTVVTPSTTVPTYPYPWHPY